VLNINSICGVGFDLLTMCRSRAC